MRVSVGSGVVVAHWLGSVTEDTMRFCGTALAVAAAQSGRKLAVLHVFSGSLSFESAGARSDFCELTLLHQSRQSAVAILIENKDSRESSMSWRLGARLLSVGRVKVEVFWDAREAATWLASTHTDVTGAPFDDIWLAGWLCCNLPDTAIEPPVCEPLWRSAPPTRDALLIGPRYSNRPDALRTSCAPVNGLGKNTV